MKRTSKTTQIPHIQEERSPVKNPFCYALAPQNCGKKFNSIHSNANCNNANAKEQQSHKLLWRLDEGTSVRVPFLETLSNTGIVTATDLYVDPIGATQSSDIQTRSSLQASRFNGASKRSLTGKEPDHVERLLKLRQNANDYDAIDDEKKTIRQFGKHPQRMDNVDYKMWAKTGLGKSKGQSNDKNRGGRPDKCVGLDEKYASAGKSKAVEGSSRFGQNRGYDDHHRDGGKYGADKTSKPLNDKRNIAGKPQTSDGARISKVVAKSDGQNNLGKGQTGADGFSKRPIEKGGSTTRSADVKEYDKNKKLHKDAGGKTKAEEATKRDGKVDTDKKKKDENYDSKIPARAGEDDVSRRQQEADRKTKTKDETKSENKDETSGEGQRIKDSLNKKEDTKKGKSKQQKTAKPDGKDNLGKEGKRASNLKKKPGDVDEDNVNKWQEDTATGTKFKDKRRQSRRSEDTAIIGETQKPRDRTSSLDGKSYFGKPRKDSDKQAMTERKSDARERSTLTKHRNENAYEKGKDGNASDNESDKHEDDPYELYHEKYEKKKVDSPIIYSRYYVEDENDVGFDDRKTKSRYSRKSASNYAKNDGKQFSQESKSGGPFINANKQTRLHLHRVVDDGNDNEKEKQFKKDVKFFFAHLPFNAHDEKTWRNLKLDEKSKKLRNRIIFDDSRLSFLKFTNMSSELHEIFLNAPKTS